MPLLRYFTHVGAALLALLFVVTPFLPEAESITRQDMARPVIRIASDRVVPPRVDFDTSQQTGVLPASVAGIPSQASALDARAELIAPPAASAAPVKIQPRIEAKIEAKVEPKIGQRKAKIAKRPDRQRVAANPQGPQPLQLTW
ncbi:MAG TPA: hypothetical protein VKS24_20225 [Bradyrhizobium sp.]|nr:hypothetical protein [Bradyrhizobium sp.]